MYALRNRVQLIGNLGHAPEVRKTETGKKLVRFIAGGAAVPVEGYEIDPENGKDIMTTLDVQMQDIVESALMKMMVQSESQFGTCIVMETATGKVKVNTEPFPFSLSTNTSPPCFSTNSLAIKRPMPKPATKEITTDVPLCSRMHS